MGTFSATVNFGGGPLTSAGLSDGFFSVRDSDGAHRWTVPIGGPSEDEVASAAFDDAGNLYAIGAFAEDMYLGDDTLSSAGGHDIFVTSWNAAGQHRWSRALGGTEGDYGKDIVVAGDRVYFVGYFSGTIDVGGGPMSTTPNAFNFLIAAFDTTGAHRWSAHVGAQPGFSYDHRGTDIAVAPDGTVYAGGSHDGSGGYYWTDLYAFDAGGTRKWSATMGANTSLDDVAVGADGEAIVVGNASGCCAYVTKWTPGGSLRWRREFRGAGVYPTAVRAGDGGEIRVAGYFIGTMDVGQGAVVASGVDAFILELTAGGETAAGRMFVVRTDQRVEGLMLDSTGETVLVGRHNAVVDFGDGELSGVGSQDGFVAHLVRGADLAPPVVTDVPDDEGRAVYVAFSAAAQDVTGARRPVVRYEVFLRNDPLPQGVTAPVATAGVPRSTLSGEWIYLLSVPATGSSDYVVVAPTLADSTRARGMHYSRFLVRAATTDPLAYFDYPRGEGWSVDNRPPGAPLGLVFADDRLRWFQATEPDFDYFSVYAAATTEYQWWEDRIGVTSGTAFVVGNTHAAYYFVTATDFAGNEGPASRVEGNPDLVPPGPPTELVWQPDMLEWTNPADSDLDHLSVYGSASAVLDGSEIHLGDTAGHVFGIAGEFHRYYHVVAVDVSGNRSLPATARDDVPPAVPAGLVLDGGLLSWQPVGDKDLGHYTVYGSPREFMDGAAVMIATTNETTLDVSATPAGHYLVTATDLAGNGSDADFVSGPDDAVAPPPVAGLEYRAYVVFWDAVAVVRDLDHYAVYGSDAGVFDAGAVLLGTTLEHAFRVETAIHAYYYVTAVDWKDNESAPVRVRDDVPPPQPAALSIEERVLQWTPSEAADFGHFDVYGSDHSDFDQPKRQLGTTTETRWDVTQDRYAGYFVTAVDRFGNTSAPSRLIVDWPPGVFSISAYPNPFNPLVTIRYELPAAGRARLAVFDARGVFVRGLVDEDAPAGARTVAWDGRDDANTPVAGGVYFVRFEFGGDTKSHKVVLLK